ncbi:MAG: TolC family protein [Methylophilaceae bacterium]
MLFGCSTELYQAKPLTPQASLNTIKDRDPNSSAFKAYLLKQGFKNADLPITAWGLRELTLCALFYHSKLNLAKAQLGLAQTALSTAGLKQSPTIGGHLSNSNQKNGDSSPWAYGLQVEIPVETGHKRALKIEEAQYLAEVARMDIAETAWQLRLAIAADLLALHENNAMILQLENESETHQKLISMLQKRVNQGLNSNIELHTAQLAQQQQLFTLTTVQAKTAEIHAALAADCGLAVEKFNQLQLKPFDLNTTIKQQNIAFSQTVTSKELQEKALLNRIDIRRGLAKYAAAESKIKLEIAKQTPDVVLSPSLAFEFGDTIWSLGINTLLNLANKNQTMIAETKQLRAVEAAQFEALQAQTLANLSQAQAQYQSAIVVMANQLQLYAAQQQQQQKQQAQFNTGLIDRLVLTQSALSQHQALQQLQTTQFSVLQAALKLQDAMQTPIERESILPSELMQ